MIENVCRYNKYGYCKFSDTCRNLHVNELCVDHQCDIAVCEKRHPRICSFYRDYGRCKYAEYCRYKHAQTVDEIKTNDFEEKLAMKDKEITQIKEEIVNNNEKMNEKESIIEIQNKVINELREKLESEEQKKAEVLDSINEKCIADMKALTVDIKHCIDFIGEMIEGCSFDIINMQEELKIKYNEKFPDTEYFCESEDNLEQTFVNPSMVISCEQCEFVAKTKTGLKTHVKKKHKNYS